jgi:hypothetical protein
MHDLSKAELLELENAACVSQHALLWFILLYCWSGALRQYVQPLLLDSIAVYDWCAAASSP